MIEEQFVSFDTAKLLKEAGFDIPCRGIYRTDRTGDYVFRKYEHKNTKDDLCWSSTDGFQYEYLAPTQALAAKWLREVHKLHVFAKRTYEYALDKFSWGYYIQSSNYEYCKNFEIGFDSYEQAIEKGLCEAIKLIKK